MNSTMSSSFFLLSLIFFLAPYPCLITAGPDSSASDNELLKKACTQAPNKDLCEKTISLSQNPKKDLNDLAFIAFDAASTNAALNIEFITHTLEDIEGSNEAEDAALLQSFQDCEQQYEGAVDEVDNAISALASRSKEDDDQIGTWLKDTIIAVQTCEKSVKGKGAKAEQLSLANQQLLELLNNAMSVFQVLEQK